jgi:hypothetical protein
MARRQQPQPVAVPTGLETKHPPAAADRGKTSPDEPDRRPLGHIIQARLDAIWRSIRDKMRDAEVDVPDDCRLGTTPDAVFPGECYCRAFLFAQTHAPTPGIWLVFGEAVLGLGSHVWVELPRGVVFDATLQRFYRRTSYYRRQRARPAYKFSAEAAVRIFRELQRRLGRVTWCWDACLQLSPPSPTGPPLRIDLAEAERRLAAGLRQLQHRRRAVERRRPFA